MRSKCAHRSFCNSLCEKSWNFFSVSENTERKSGLPNLCTSIKFRGGDWHSVGNMQYVRDMFPCECEDVFCDMPNKFIYVIQCIAYCAFCGRHGSTEKILILTVQILLHQWQFIGELLALWLFNICIFLDTYLNSKQTTRQCQFNCLLFSKNFLNTLLCIIFSLFRYNLWYLSNSFHC